MFPLGRRGGHGRVLFNPEIWNECRGGGRMERCMIHSVGATAFRAQADAMR